ncbi:MAG: orotidine-5'-phosphate decarboxylase [Micrococcales bacterium]
MPTSFGNRLAHSFQSHGQLCVGIDPHASLLADWGLADSVVGLREFANVVLGESVGRVGILKPQVSFFERFGSAGFAVLEDICERATQQGLLVIMDVKRGDIGTTMDAYFDAWLGQGAPFICDAVTVSPFLGFDSLNPFFSRASERGKGVFVLAATSNPEGARLQQARNIDGQTVSASIWQSLGAVNRVTSSAGETMGSFGAVVGATLNLTKFDINSLLVDTPQIYTPILAPGFGAQGARLADCGRLFGAAAKSVIASVSRSVLAAGQAGLADAIADAQLELAEGLA